MGDHDRVSLERSMWVTMTGMIGAVHVGDHDRV